MAGRLPADKKATAIAAATPPDLKIIRYKIPSWDNLSLQQKKYAYYLTQAGYAGREIIYDQNYRHNLAIKRSLEKVYTSFEGDKTTEDWKNFELYLKRIWFANGIHHHYSNDKFKPGFSEDYLKSIMKETGVDELKAEAMKAIFDPSFDAKKVNLSKEKPETLRAEIKEEGPGIGIIDIASS